MEGTNQNFTGKKPRKYYPSQVIKAKITSNIHVNIYNIM